MTGIKDLRTTLSLGTKNLRIIYIPPSSGCQIFILAEPMHKHVHTLLSTLYALLSQKCVQTTYIPLSINKFTRHTLPPIIALWTQFDGPEYIQGHIYHLSFSRLEEGHRIFLHGYLVGEVIRIDKLINDPEHVRVLIVFQIHPLGKCFRSFLMPIYYAMGGYGG